MANPYIAVAGGINIDICGRSDRALIARDSNPGTVRLSMGGVGRNIAHNLSLLGHRVKMLTAVGGDFYARTVRQSCGTLGIDLSSALQVPDGFTSTYVFITGPDGDMELAVCDAALAGRITPEYLNGCRDVLNGASAVVLETNLPGESIRWLAENCEAPLFADPVSVTKAEKLRPVLGMLHTLKPNVLEAELLSGVTITGEASLERAAQVLLDTGLRRVFISMGAEGLYCASADGARCRLSCLPTKLRNATGGGDALMAGIVSGFSRGLSMRESGLLGLACGSICVEGTDTINSALSYEAARNKIITEESL